MESTTFYYVLPGAGIYGGVKKGVHCVELLDHGGFAAAVATPGAERPSWLASGARFVAREELPGLCTAEDVVLFSSPADAGFVESLPARRRIVHMQGANTPDDHALFARDFEFVSHGLHMSYELLRHGRVAPYVPMGIPEAFRWRGEPKVRGSVALMPRKGREFADAVAAALPSGTPLARIDGLCELEVAEILKRTDTFVAVSPVEALGLPPLEAQCAGCCVVGFPGDGGFEFLRHGETAHLVPNGDAAGLVAAVLEVLARPSYRDALRDRAMAACRGYTMEREREFLLRALGLTRE